LNATLPRDLASPEACAARQARIAAANEAHRARMYALASARAAYRKHAVRNAYELKQALENIVSASMGRCDSVTEEYAKKVTDLICDLEGELYGMELELSAIRSMEMS
jgi:hypothetical protein